MELVLQLHTSFKLQEVLVESRVHPAAKAARGHATSCSPCIDSMVLSFTFLVKIVYGTITNIERKVFPGNGSNKVKC